MFKKVLIANRGAIACRIARTLRRMNVGVVAVYTKADADSLHVEAADEAVCIGEALAAESYLDGGRIIAIDPPSLMIDQLMASGFTPEKEVRGASLEDVFIRLTGHALREA